MTIDELKQMWEKDAIVGDDLGGAAIQGSKLHAKYLDHLITAKLKVTKIEHEIAELKARKAKYFRGEMGKEELDLYGWEQWHYKTMKSDIGDVIEADADYQKIMARLSYMKTMIYQLESILNELRSRGFAIKSAIEWQRFRAGA